MSKKRKSTLVAATTLIVASVVIMGAVSVVVQQRAYAQDGEGITVTADCFEDDNGGLTILVSGEGEREGFGYRTDIHNSDSSTIAGRTDSFIDAIQRFVRPGETYTIKVFEFPAGENPNSGALVATTTVDCPPLTDFFANQGQCIEHSKIVNNGFRITKEDCKAAFKA